MLAHKTNTARLIDGKAHAAAWLAAVKVETAALSAAHGRCPGLATILVGDAPASAVYVSMKRKKAQALGFHDQHIALPATLSQAALNAELTALNANPAIDAILVQLPLPAHLDIEQMIDVLGPQKDVDGFHSTTLGKCFRAYHSDLIAPCTPFGIMKLLQCENITLAGKHVVIVGRSNLVGKPLAAMLMQKNGGNATVTVVHSGTIALTQHTQSADVLIAAAGQPQLITAEHVKTGAVVIDVGTNKLANGRLVGDVDFPAVSQKAALLTPVPGGVGPMTIAALMANTLKLFKQHTTA